MKLKCAVPRLVATRRLVALATPPLFLEYEDVLKRPEHRLAHGLAPEAIAEEFLAELAALIEPVEVHCVMEMIKRHVASSLTTALLWG